MSDWSDRYERQIIRAQRAESDADGLAAAIESEPECISNPAQIPTPCGLCMACRLRRALTKHRRRKDPW